ncbi:MAG TPA: 50S ribosomal protein L15 [Patescibacteria group bacterium]|nr:50S ribosomal protein L15 [Patescibacteria group bacterium]
MNLNNLSTITTKRKKRLGQGHGSGRVKTSGRGTKGQNARSSRPLRFEGGALPLTKRLPFLRGKMKNKMYRQKPLVLNVGALNNLPDTVVSIETLVKYKLVRLDDAKLKGVKILGDGELTAALTVSLPVSKSAQKKIEKAGGSVKLTEKI